MRKDETSEGREKAGAAGGPAEGAALCGLTPEEVGKLEVMSGQPGFRTRQLVEWIWAKQAGSFEEMTNLPQRLREDLAASCSLVPLEHVLTKGSEDTTRKFLLKLRDGRLIECVLIPASQGKDGERARRMTLCVSSQVGCAYGCKFCASGLDGLARNLSVAEIAGQVLMAQRLSQQRVDNVVFMGMGEPMANFRNVLGAIHMMTAPWGAGIGARHITVSTSGLVPRILELAQYPQQIRLAISLHGATDEVREQIMPVNKRWPLAKLFEALEEWNRHKKQFLTLEYILIAGVNDSLHQARLLAQRASKLRAKVNLIPYNTVQGLDWQRPAWKHCEAFQRVLTSAGVGATLRMEKGHDIEAACGQLRLQEEKATFAPKGDGMLH